MQIKSPLNPIVSIKQKLNHMQGTVVGGHNANTIHDNKGKIIRTNNYYNANVHYN